MRSDGSAMERPAPPHPSLAHGPFVRADGLVVETARRLRGPAFHRVFRGVYDVATADLDHGRRIRALRLVLPAHAVLVGASAAWVWGVRLHRSGTAVEVCLPDRERVRCRAGLVVHCYALRRTEVRSSRSGPVTTPARTAFDLARSLPPREAVRWVDAVLRSTGTPVAAATAFTARPGVRGVRAARRLLPLADPLSESPQESLLRWVLVTAGLPAPRSQWVVHDADNRFVARLDLAWPLQQVGVEYDGVHHREPAQHRRDLERHNRLRSCGWCVLQVDATQLHDEERLVRLVRRTLAQADPTAFTPGGRRAGGR